MLVRRMQSKSRASSGRSDPVALLDTNVLFTSASACDDYHNRAQEIVRGIDYGDLPDVIRSLPLIISDRNWKFVVVFRERTEPPEVV
jgi:hypothetical protein